MNAPDLPTAVKDQLVSKGRSPARGSRLDGQYRRARSEAEDQLGDFVHEQAARQASNINISPVHDVVTWLFKNGATGEDMLPEMPASAP